MLLEIAAEEDTMISIKGTFQNGVAQPSKAITDREGQAVIITFVEDVAPKNVSDDLPNGDETLSDWDKLMHSIEQHTMDAGIEDLSYQHDHYLHGKPKQD